MSSDPEKPEPPVRSSSLSYQSRPKPPHHSESLSLERHIHHLHEPTSPLQRHKGTVHFNFDNLPKRNSNGASDISLTFVCSML